MDVLMASSKTSLTYLCNFYIFIIIANQAAKYPGSSLTGLLRLNLIGYLLWTSLSFLIKVWLKSIVVVFFFSLESYSRKVFQFLSLRSCLVTIWSLYKKNRFSPLVLGIERCIKDSSVAKISYSGNLSLSSTSFKYWWPESEVKRCDFSGWDWKLNLL